MSLPGPAVLACPECEGSGFAPIPDEPEFDVDIPCLSCSGVGVVPSPEAVEAAARAMLNRMEINDDTPIQFEMAQELARAALGEFLRLNKEGK